MHPRVTRHRPLIYNGMKGYQVFADLGGSCSPFSVRPILAVLFPETYQSRLSTFWVDAVSCYKILPKKTIKFPSAAVSCAGSSFSLNLDWFIVEFWDGANSSADASLSIGVYAPSYICTSGCFLFSSHLLCIWATTSLFFAVLDLRSSFIPS
mmetsp:Transcript_408/g.609  ORF Transcript_408/g.609 Transcript_408/m.609 type:complete len:152 (-) Transcript_408:249-704(-)